MKSSFASAALLLTMTGYVSAADLPSRQSAPVYIAPVPTFTWTGFYVGGQVGYEFGTTTDTIVVAPVALGPFQVGQTAAAVGGVHVGYLYQFGGAGLGGLFGGALVAGIEGDLEGSNNTSTVPFVGVDQHKGTIEGSIRGRLGIAVDRALFYATGGAAFAQFKDQITTPAAIFASSTSKVGYSIGGGLDYAITPNWSLRGEYRYTDFGHYSNMFAGGAGTTIHKVVEQKVELGVSYRFADPVAPIVARY